MDNIAEQGINPNITSNEESRQQQVDRITENDLRAFEEWSAQVGQDPRLDMPLAALRYLMIPKRILELAQDPSQVDLVAIKNLEDEARVLVVEHRSQPVSDPQSLNQYLESLRQFHEAERARQRAEGRRIYIPPKVGIPITPVDVDEEHLRYRDLLDDGTISINDYITNHLDLRRESNHETLYVAHYDDRSDLRGRGVASSFYHRLPEVARDIGFRFVVGWNEERNVGFFINKLGRSRINEIKQEDRSLFGATPTEVKGEQRLGDKIRTVQFLYPEDKGRYLIGSNT